MYFIKVVLISLALLINRNSFAQPEDHTTDQNEVEKKCSSDKEVCGTDGKTYNNICLLQKETGVTLAHEGDCKRKKKKKAAYRPDLILKSKIVNATEESLQKKLVKHFNPTTGKWEYVIEIFPTIVITPTFHHLQMADQPSPYNITNMKTSADLKTVGAAKAPSKFGVKASFAKTAGGMYPKRKLIIDNLKGPFNRNNSIIKEIVRNVTNNFPRTQVENKDFVPMENETISSFNTSVSHPNQSHPSAFPSQQITGKKSPVPQLQTLLNKPEPLNSDVPTEFPYQESFRSSETPPSFNISESHPNQSHPSVFPSQKITEEKSPVPQLQTLLNKPEPLNSVVPTEFPYQQSFRSSETPPSFNTSESHPNQSHPSVFPSQEITEEKSPVPQLQTLLNKPEPLKSVVPSELSYQQSFRGSETPPSFNTSESHPNQSHPSVFPSQQITEKKSPVPQLQTELNKPKPLNTVIVPTEFPYQQSFRGSETPPSLNASESHPNHSHPSVFPSQEITEEKSPVPQLQTLLNKPEPLKSVVPSELSYQQSFRGSETPPSFNASESHPNHSHPSVFPSQQITEKISSVPQLQTVLKKPKPLNSAVPTEFPYEQSFRSSETPPSFNTSRSHPNQSHPSTFPSQQITEKKSPVPYHQSVLNKPKPLKSVVVPTEFPYQQGFPSSETPPSFNVSESHPNHSHPSVFPSQQITEKISPVPQLQTLLNKPEPLNSVVVPTEFPYEQSFRSSETPPSFNASESVFPWQETSKVTVKKSPVHRLVKQPKSLDLGYVKKKKSPRQRHLPIHRKNHTTSHKRKPKNHTIPEQPKDRKITPEPTITPFNPVSAVSSLKQFNMTDLLHKNVSTGNKSNEVQPRRNQTLPEKPVINNDTDSRINGSLDTLTNSEMPITLHENATKTPEETSGNNASQILNSKLQNYQIPKKTNKNLRAPDKPHSLDHIKPLLSVPSVFLDLDSDQQKLNQKENNTFKPPSGISPYSTTMDNVTKPNIFHPNNITGNKGPHKKDHLVKKLSQSRRKLIASPPRLGSQKTAVIFPPIRGNHSTGKVNITINKTHLLNPVGYQFTVAAPQPQLWIPPVSENPKKNITQTEPNGDIKPKTNPKIATYNLKLPGNISDYVDLEINWSILPSTTNQPNLTINVSEVVGSKNYTWSEDTKYATDTSAYHKLRSGRLKPINENIQRIVDKDVWRNSNSKNPQYVVNNRETDGEPIKIAKTAEIKTYQLEDEERLKENMESGLSPNWEKHVNPPLQDKKFSHNVEKHGSYSLDVPSNLAGNFKLIFSWTLKNKLPKSIRTPIDVTEKQVKYDYKWKIGGNNKGGQPIGNEEIQPIKSVNVTADKTVTPMKHSFGERGLTGRKIPTRRLHNLVERLGNVHLGIPKINTTSASVKTEKTRPATNLYPGWYYMEMLFNVPGGDGSANSNNYSDDTRKVTNGPDRLE